MHKHQIKKEKKHKLKKNKKSRDLKRKIDEQHLKLFGKDYHNYDKKLMKKQDPNTTKKRHDYIDYNISETEISDEDITFNVIKKININVDVVEMIEPPTIKSNIQISRLKLKYILSKLKNTISLIIDKDNQHLLIEKIAEHFFHSDCLKKYNGESTEYKLIEELIIKLIEKLNDTKYNMVKLSSYLVCVFYKTAKKSSIPTNEIMNKYIMFIHIIKNIIYNYDMNMWTKLFLPDMFMDWLIVLASFYIKHVYNIQLLIKNDIPLIRNAIIYFNHILCNKYIAINESNKKTKTVKKGIFEFTNSDDIIEVDNLLNASKVKVINHQCRQLINDNREPKLKNTEVECIQTTNQNVVKEIHNSQLQPRISVRAEFNLSNLLKNLPNPFLVLIPTSNNDTNTTKVPDNDLNITRLLESNNSIISKKTSKRKSSVKKTTKSAKQRKSNVNKEVVLSIPQDISTIGELPQKLNVSYSPNINLSQYYKNISANSSSTLPSTFNTQLNNNVQFNYYNTHTPTQSNNINSVMNTTYGINNISCNSILSNLPNTHFAHPETTNLPSQPPSSTFVPSLLNTLTYPTNFNNTQLSSISAMPALASSRFNNCTYSNCIECSMSAANMSSSIPTPTINFQPTDYHSQVIVGFDLIYFSLLSLQ